jgi:Cys-rich four helix bundle protein (predicted Tat secretion target)
MNRRNAIANASAVIVAALGTAALAQEHDHSKMMGASGGKYQLLADTTADCVAKGQACIAHCLILMADGDKEMGACAKAANQMLALCTALQSLANQQSSLVPALAKTALEACQLCEKECRKHEKHHATCKACADSCAACIKQCKAVAA